MCVCVPFYDQETFALRMYVTVCTYVYMCIYATPPTSNVLYACITIVLGCWPGQLNTCIYMCVCICMYTYTNIDPSSDHGLGQIPRWIQPVVLPFILCVSNIVRLRGFLEATMPKKEKNEKRKRETEPACSASPFPQFPIP